MNKVYIKGKRFFAPILAASTLLALFISPAFATLPVVELSLLEHSKPRTETITHIVLHYMSNVVANPKDPYIIEEAARIFALNGVSAHYIIGRDGTIYFCVPEHRVAYHAGKGVLEDYPNYKDSLNQYSVGIEILAIGTYEEMAGYGITAEMYSKLDPAHIGFTEMQYESLNHLINDILSRHSSISSDRRHIIGHNEYAPGRKQDPGALFDWNRVSLSTNRKYNNE
ncbi:MAG: N-acetylmuramoyl-L-alanine amidase [Fibromonadaceae bacterium]|jgi:N-acetyl-anhydromuramyl-L-alanine amidase AmpD|nr:N-acetylmuramoyl-L-alanine amidase [Fibromonadaceae bacterium]